MSNYVLISKDAMCTDYLPIYGNKYWYTPNIEQLALKGTVFYNHYTAAPSTVMSFYSMITGIYGHETDYEMYEKMHDVFKGETLFTKLKKRGYDCHIIWADICTVLPMYYDCYRDDVKIHEHKNFRQGVGAHYSHKGFLRPSADKVEKTFVETIEMVKEILQGKNNVFLWIHFPHVINGCVSYGSDIELFDRYIGEIRKYVPDECITITSDHGNMNGHKGKICYGHDVYQPAVRIPLITPRIENINIYSQNSTATDLFEILFDKTIPKHEFIYSDSAYKAQKNRKLAIIKDNFKYIYNKKTGKEELYDVKFDPNEEFSLMEDYVFDPDRKNKAPSRELYYYPLWDELPNVRKMMRKEKDRIWKNGSFLITIKSNIKDFIRPVFTKLHKSKSTAVTTK